MSEHEHDLKLMLKQFVSVTCHDLPTTYLYNCILNHFRETFLKNCWTKMGYCRQHNSVNKIYILKQIDHEVHHQHEDILQGEYLSACHKLLLLSNSGLTLVVSKIEYVGKK